MDTKFIVLLVVLSIIAGVFMLYEYDRLINDSLLWEDLNEHVLMCAQEGEYLSGTDGLPRVCCSGLNALNSMFVDETGQCQLGAEASICVSTDCGDGVCQEQENHCNCQDDCTQGCAQEGETVFANPNFGVTRCCSTSSGIKPTSHLKGDLCVSTQNGALGVCDEDWDDLCGDGTCDVNNEDGCNCPEDCR